MPRVRTRPINKFVQNLMDEFGVTTLKELSSVTGIAESTLRNWAEIEGHHQSFESLLNAAQRLNKKPEDIIRGLLGQAS